MSPPVQVLPYQPAWPAAFEARGIADKATAMAGGNAELFMGAVKRMAPLKPAGFQKFRRRAG